jgi:peptidyl-prolyl cis-trans isomerase SurA
VDRVAKRVAVIAAAAALVVATAGSACKRGETGGGSKDVAASVNGKDITLGEVDRVITQQPGGQQALSPLELGARRLQVLDDLIKQEVLFQRAEKEKLLPSDDEITQVINEQKQQSGITSDVYQRILKESGQTEEGLRQVARKQLAIRKLLERVDGKIDAPTDKEVEDYYNANRERYVSARGVGLAAIYADPQDNGATNDAKSDSEAQNKINIIYQRLKGGGDFATVAREQSEDPNTVSRGGEIGFFSEEELKRAGFPDDLISKFFGSEMQIGDITAPTKGSDSRWSIWKLTSRRLQSENLTLDRPEVRKDAADNIVDTRKQLINAALLEVALREAKIENKLAESMLNSANSLSSLRPAGAARPGAPAPGPAASSSPAASASPAQSPATPAASATPRPANASNANGARPAANVNAAPPRNINAGATRNVNAAAPARAANSNR